MRVQTNEKKVDRDATLLNLKSDPDRISIKQEKVGLLVSPIVSEVIVIDDDDDDDNDNESGAINAKGIVQSPSILELVKSDKKLEQEVLVKVEKCTPSVLKRKVDEIKSKEAFKKSRTSDERPSIVPSSSHSAKPVQAQLASNNMSSFVKKNFSNFAEKLLCLKKNYKTMTDDQMIKVFYDLKCKICDMDLDFDSMKEFSEHYNQDHGNEKLKIECCGIKIPELMLVSHIKHHLGVEKLSLKQHVEQLESQFFCDKCGKAFVKEHILQMHLRFDNCSSVTDQIKSIKKEYICDVCQNSYENKTYLENHIKQKHLKLARISCMYCDQKFQHYRYLTTHLSKDHSDMKEFDDKLECNVCQKPFKQRSMLTLHALSHLSAEEKANHKKFKCSQCNFETISIQKLRVHQSRKHGESRKSYDCKICPKSFESRIKLHYHQATHLDKADQHKMKPHKCPYCDKRFWFQSIVSQHIQNVHRCNLCFELFVSMEEFDKHKQNVHNVKSDAKRRSLGVFICEYCDKNFRQENTYKVHLQEWHLGGYLYECKWCSAKYNDRKSFREHEKKLHSDKL